MKCSGMLYWPGRGLEWSLALIGRLKCSPEGQRLERGQAGFRDLAVSLQDRIGLLRS